MKTIKTILNEDFQIVLDSIRKLFRTIRISTKATENSLGLSASQIFVLQRLSQKESMTISELAEATFAQQNSVSVVVSKLIQRQLIERVNSKTSGHHHEFRLSSQGFYLVGKSPLSIQDRLHAGFMQLNDYEKKELVRSLDKFLEKSGLQQEKAAMFIEDAADAEA